MKNEEGGSPSTAFAYIPFGYISDARQRIEAYRKLAQVTDKAGLDSLERELCDRFGCLLVSVRLDEIGVPRAWVPDLAYLLEEDPFFIDPVASALIAHHCRQLHDHVGTIPQAVLQRMATAMGVSAVAWQDDSFVIEFPVRFLLGALDWEFAHLE